MSSKEEELRKQFVEFGMEHVLKELEEINDKVKKEFEENKEENVFFCHLDTYFHLNRKKSKITIGLFIDGKLTANEYVYKEGMDLFCEIVEYKGKCKNNYVEKMFRKIMMVNDNL